VIATSKCTLKELPTLLADQEHRAKEPPAISSSAATAPSTGAKAHRANGIPSFVDDENQLPQAAAWEARVDSVADKNERIKLEIQSLEDVAARPFSNPGGVQFDWDPLVARIIAEGQDAVEPLLDCYEKDTRLTRSAESGEGLRYGDIIPVKAAAYAALCDILQTRNFPSDDVRAYWKQYHAVSKEERWFNTLANDKLDRKSWLEAAQNIVVEGSSLRSKKDPSVSELMAKRVDAMVQEAASSPSSDKFFELDDANRLAMALVKWSLDKASPSLRKVFDQARAMDFSWSSQDQMSSRIVSDETDALATCGDKAALSDHAQWLKRQTPKDIANALGWALRPMWRHPDDPAIKAAAEWVFNDADSTWNPVAGGSGSRKMSFGFGDVFTNGMITLEAFRKQALRQLADTHRGHGTGRDILAVQRNSNS
jgi:hypothetical protein